MNTLFPTYEIGSLPKLNARVKAFAANPKNPVSKKDIKEIIRHSKRAGLNESYITPILEKQKKRGRKLTSEERAVVIDFNALLNLKLQEAAGLDIVYDGEARRIEMYRHAALQIDGFVDVAEPLRSRGPDSWTASICVAEPRLKGTLDELPILGEFRFVKENASRAAKIPLDDPYMIANMTLDRYFTELLAPQYKGKPRELRYAAKHALTMALAQNIIRPQVESAAKAGAEWIQLDIPSATIDIEHIPIMVEGINAVVDGIDGVKFSLHICYPRRVSLTDKSGYELLFPHLLKLDQKVNHISLELANGNQYERDLRPFADYQKDRELEIGLGVVDITLERQQKGLIETPEIVRDRILTAARILKNPSLVYVAPDCGLRQLSLERALKLYEVIVRGAELARKG